MKNMKSVLVVLLLLTVSSSCKLLNRKTSRGKGPAIDFTTPGKPRNVTVQLDKKQTASAQVRRTGGSVSLAATDGSKFTLDVPANALDADTTVTMTAVKSIDGAPLDSNTPTAVQLEPSGLFFKEMATLTIVPARDIPIKQQVIFSYEGDGQDYHLAMVDPKSKDIKVKLMGFSGAGVGSAADAAWAANLMIQAHDARARLNHKTGEIFQAQRREDLMGEGLVEGTETWERVESELGQFEDQVLQKELVAAELDCKHAPEALESLLSLDRTRSLMGFPRISGFYDKFQKLIKIIQECPAPYQIVGGLDDWQTNTLVCDIMKPFTLTGGGFTMQLSGGLSGTYTYSGPFNAQGSGTYTISLPDGIGKPGSMTGGGAGQITGNRVYTGSGNEHYTLTPINSCK